MFTPALRLDGSVDASSVSKVFFDAKEAEIEMQIGMAIATCVPPEARQFFVLPLEWCRLDWDSVEDYVGAYSNYGADMDSVPSSTAQIVYPRGGTTFFAEARDDGRVMTMSAVAHMMAPLQGVFKALMALHSAGLVHLDVKPDNILMPLVPPPTPAATATSPTPTSAPPSCSSTTATQGMAQLIDFGLVDSVTPMSVELPWPRSTGVLRGTKKLLFARRPKGPDTNGQDCSSVFTVPVRVLAPVRMTVQFAGRLSSFVDVRSNWSEYWPMELALHNTIHAPAGRRAILRRQYAELWAPLLAWFSASWEGGTGSKLASKMPADSPIRAVMHANVQLCRELQRGAEARLNLLDMAIDTLLTKAFPCPGPHEDGGPETVLRGGDVCEFWDDIRARLPVQFEAVMGPGPPVLPTSDVVPVATVTADVHLMRVSLVAFVPLLLCAVDVYGFGCSLLHARPLVWRAATAHGPHAAHILPMFDALIASMLDADPTRRATAGEAHATFLAWLGAIEACERLEEPVPCGEC